MVALLKFENGKKIFEAVCIDGEELLKDMISSKESSLLVSSDGTKRMTKGTIPEKVFGSFSWIK